MLHFIDKLTQPIMHILHVAHGGNGKCSHTHRLHFVSDLKDDLKAFGAEIYEDLLAEN